MPSILDTYKKRADELGVSKIGPDNIDATPYSLGKGLAGKKDIDDSAVKKFESEKGPRYGVGDFGGGSKFSPGHTDTKKYSDTVKFNP